MKTGFKLHFLSIGIMAISICAVTSQAQWASQAIDVPAHHEQAPAKGETLPPILSGMQLTGPNFQQRIQTHAYELAAKIPRTLYQQPCYCHCDRSMRHSSLQSCFSSLHGAECTTCMQELYYTYKMNKLKKTPAEIRAGIIRGDYKSIGEKEAVEMN